MPVTRPLGYDPGVRYSISGSLCVGTLLSALAGAAEPKPIDFGRDVRPVLERACWKCHGPEKQRGGLRLDRREGALAAGDSGRRAVSPGHPAESALIRRVEAPDPAERMPQRADPLPREENR